MENQPLTMLTSSWLSWIHKLCKSLMNYVNLNETKIKFYKRLLDDILLISKGNNCDVNNVINAINQVIVSSLFSFWYATTTI